VAFLIAEGLSRHSPDDPIDAVVLVMDTDDEQVECPRGVKAARDEALGWKLFRIICGFPDPEREAWVLAGFEVCDPFEQQRLDEVHRELGFSPVLHAVKLRDKTHGAPRNIKRVLGVLTGDDPDREARCWAEPPLATLHERGAATGLSAFLAELQAMLPGLRGAGPGT
jgi:hypothetical protein